MMAWHWDQAVRSSHGAHGACLVFVGCPIKRAISCSSRSTSTARKSRKSRKKLSGRVGCMCEQGRRDVVSEPKVRAQSATHKDRPFLLTA